MRRVNLCVVICVMALLSGCFTSHVINAPSGSQWESAEGTFNVTINEQHSGAGTLVVDDEVMPITCHFGHGEKEFHALLNTSSASPAEELFSGEYVYNEELGTITIKVKQDYCGLGWEEIILYKTEQ